MIFLTMPPSGAVIGFITFIASTISRVSPAFTASPTSMNGFAPGSGDMKAVPTIGDLTVSPATSSCRRSLAAVSRLQRPERQAGAAAPARERQRMPSARRGGP